MTGFIVKNVILALIALAIMYGGMRVQRRGGVFAIFGHLGLYIALVVFGLAVIAIGRALLGYPTS